MQGKIEVPEPMEWEASIHADNRIVVGTHFANCQSSLDRQILIHHHNYEVMRHSVLRGFFLAWQEHQYEPSVGSLQRLNEAEKACRLEFGGVQRIY
mgnify:CR=1 FL=1